MALICGSAIVSNTDYTVSQANIAAGAIELSDDDLQACPLIRVEAKTIKEETGWDSLAKFSMKN